MNVEQIRTFLTAGWATFTLHSKKTNTHYTFRSVAANDERNLFWISLLTAPDTYTYMGSLFLNTPWRFVTTRKSPLRHPVSDVLRWFFRVINNDTLPAALVFRHANCCGRCQRQLTTPESIDTGLGPVCAEKLGVPHVKAAQ